MADISSVTAATLGPLGGVSPLRALASSPLLGLGGGVGGLSPFGGASVVVELSEFGQVLSAAAAFEGSLARLQPGSATSGVGLNFGDDFASLAAETQFFVDAFNHLQSDLASLQGGFGGSSPGLPLAAELNRQFGASFANGDSALTRLADLGITLQADPVAGNPLATRLSVDLDALRQAFAQDPEGSFSLLAEAARAFGEVAGDFTAQGGGLTPSLESLARSIALTQTLSLFGGLSEFSPVGGSGNALQGLPGLLLLDALSRGGSGANRQVAALSQFLLVSSLLE